MGGPASGKPAGRGPAKGPGKGTGKGTGWGGPAKGPGNGKRPPPFTSENRPIPPILSPEERLARKDARAAKKLSMEQRQAAALAAIEDLIFDADRDETRLTAAQAFLNRTAGMPVAMTLNHNVEMSFEDLVRASIKPAK